MFFWRYLFLYVNLFVSRFIKPYVGVTRTLKVDEAFVRTRSHFGLNRFSGLSVCSAHSISIVFRDICYYGHWVLVVLAWLLGKYHLYYGNFVFE